MNGLPVVAGNGAAREIYAAARAASPRVHEHFVRHREDLQRQGHDVLAPLPDVETIAALVDAAFWASLRREEGYVPKISLALVPPEEAVHPLLFERPLPLSPAALTRVSLAVERPGVHLGVSPGDRELTVWGVTRTIPKLCFVLEVASPGLLVVKHYSGAETGKFVNIAVIEGDQIKVVDERASSLPDCPPLLISMLGFDAPASWADSVNVLVRLAVSMRAHGHGGSLLVVPSGSDTWRESIVQPIPYAVSPPFEELAYLSRSLSDDANRSASQEALARTMDTIAGLTAVDGAVVLTDRFELLGFGAKIARRKGRPQVEQIVVTEPVEGGVAELMHPEQLGGTRHLSAAQFVQDQQDSVALVASQDGRFTVFAWSPCEAKVHAHRVEVLLL